jgi:hypothetical protein
LSDLDINGNIDTCGEVELLQLVDRRGGWLNDVNESFMGTDLKLLHRLFVNVYGAINGEFLNAGGHGNGAGNAGSGTFGGFDDIQSGLVDNAVIKAF